MEVPQTLDANVILKIDLNDTSGNQSMNPPVSSTPGEVLASNQNSPIIMPVVQETIAQSYVDQSMIPKGHSILAKGGGMSNAAVQYTNSRSFKNVYKDIGSLEPSELLQGLALGRGMSKGQSILNSGGGLSGMSLFKMEHYNPIDTTDNAIGGGEEKHDEDDDDTGDDDEYSYSSVSSVDTDEEKGTNPTTPTASKDLGTTFELTPEAKRKQIEDILKANYEVQRLHELTQAKKKADIEKHNKYLEIKKLKRKARDAKKAAMDAKKAASAKPITDDDDGDDTDISTDVTDEEKGTNPSTPELTSDARLKQIEEMLKAKKKAEIEKKKLKRKEREAKKAASAKPTTDDDDAEPVIQISLIDRLIKNAPDLEKAFQSKSGDKTWVIVMENGDVKSGNIAKMKTALNKVGVTANMTAGLKKVKKFEKHKLGQAYHISKSMLTKALGITDTELKDLAKTDKWGDDMAVKLMMLDFPDVPNKDPDAIVVQKSPGKKGKKPNKT